MKTVQFKCTMLSDVILNVKSATEGNQQTLDFIPGSSFLGVSAGELYQNIDPDHSMLLFHSGKVRFGDAHPMINGKRAFRTPLSWFYPKNAEINDELYVHHFSAADGLKDENDNPVQLKQCRVNYFLHEDGRKYRELKIARSFAIKSAYDSDKRRAEDSKMYGYEAIRSGSTWCFELAFDEDVPEDLREKTVKSLMGHKRIGRSSTAQFGLVLIEKTAYSNGFSQADLKDNVLLYADSRLMFMDDFGQPTFTPSAADLGFEGGTINWQKSQVRTFQYAPFNGARMTHDNDRCGIEKGSVLFIEGVSEKTTDHVKIQRGLGLYLNEGFGRVTINPAFLNSKPGSDDGKADVEIVTVSKKIEKSGVLLNSLSENATASDKLVLEYLGSEKKKTDEALKILNQVNSFVTANENVFKGASFASQWGTIRAKAVIALSKTDLISKLFDPDHGYLTHGVAAEKWSERRRAYLLKKFINENLSDFSDQSLLKTIVNLSAEMAKKSK